MGQTRMEIEAYLNYLTLILSNAACLYYTAHRLSIVPHEKNPEYILPAQY